MSFHSSSDQPESAGDGAPSPRQRHRFWSTQPVPQRSGEDDSPSSSPGPIATKRVEDVRARPYALPAGFAWCTLDVDDDAALAEVHALLRDHYVEDATSTFRFDYSKPFLRWALRPPGAPREFAVGVRATSSGRLLATITGVPARVRVGDSELAVVEINFLCAHRKLRRHRLAPVLIKEVTRRVERTGVWQAVYTAGVRLPTPVATCTFHHRLLDVRRLVRMGFASLRRNMTMKAMMRLHALPAETRTRGLREMCAADVRAARRLLDAHLRKFELAPLYRTDAEVAHWFLPRAGCVSTYVVDDTSREKEEEGPSSERRRLAGLVSFFHLRSNVFLPNGGRDTLRAAYSFYTAAADSRERARDLLHDALILAKRQGFDVFNMMDAMDNATFLDELRFVPGDGRLNYYLYNWRCARPLEPRDVGLVLF